MKIGVIGAGLFGVSVALRMAKKGHDVTVFESNDAILQNASAINQARLHKGLHYPRHIRTASDAYSTYGPFVSRWPSVVKEVTQYYAVSSNNSKVSGSEFEEFVKKIGVDFEIMERHPLLPFENIDAILKVTESTFDVDLLRQVIANEIRSEKRIKLLLQSKILLLSETSNSVKVTLTSKSEHLFDQVFVCSYAMNKRFAEMLDVEFYSTKFQVCEVLIGKAPQLVNEGITVMDGPFWSIMPFGFTGLHSLTHVSHTPLIESKDELLFCQLKHRECGMVNTHQCSKCEYLPNSKKKEILNEVSEFTKGKLSFEYESSIFTLKAVLNDPDMDGRPTMIQRSPSERTIFIFSGKVGDVENLDYLLNQF